MTSVDGRVRTVLEAVHLDPLPVSDGFSSYLQVRYQITNLFTMPEATLTRRDRTAHDIYLKAGVSYLVGGAK